MTLVVDPYAAASAGANVVAFVGCLANRFRWRQIVHLVTTRCRVTLECDPFQTPFSSRDPLPVLGKVRFRAHVEQTHNSRLVILFDAARVIATFLRFDHHGGNLT